MTVTGAVVLVEFAETGRGAPTLARTASGLADARSTLEMSSSRSSWCMNEQHTPSPLSISGAIVTLCRVGLASVLSPCTAPVGGPLLAPLW